jgi:UDP-2-acetamido-3-amino-2,3-dideoxy-glucuronate N-acetyltransferase
VLQPTIDTSAVISPSAQIWGNAQIREGVSIGARTIIGNGAYLDKNVYVGSDCKIQNNALIYSPAKLFDGVFVGPGSVLTNDRYPRAITSNGTLKGADEWSPVGVTAQFGASIGAGAICVAPLNLGSWSLVAAGAVVTRDVKDYELVGGNPARHLGWVGKSGHKLVSVEENKFVCPKTNESYSLNTTTHSLTRDDDD